MSVKSLDWHPSKQVSVVKSCYVGSRYYFYTGACVLISARAVPFQGTAGISARLFTNETPDTPANDVQVGVIETPGKRTLDEPPILYPYGIYAEIDGVLVTDYCDIEVVYILWEDYAEMYPDDAAEAKRRWEGSAGRQGSDFLDGFDTGLADAGAWANDGSPASPSSGGGVTDHGGLTGLADDEHPQYVLAGGTRAFTGDIDVGANNITNVGTVDGRTLSTDGAKLDGIPSNAAALLVDVTQVEAEAGTETAWRSWSPLRVSQAIAALGGGGGGGGTDISVLSVKKSTAGTINKGDVVYAAGYSTGVTVELADGNLASAQPPIGVANASITNSTAGDIALAGVVTGIDTSAFTAGDYVYLSETAGALVGTRPAQDWVWRIGTVLYADATNGILAVQIQKVQGIHYFTYGLDSISATNNNGSGIVQMAGSIASIKFSPYKTTVSDASNYWEFDPWNESNGNAKFLAAPYNTNTDGDITKFTPTDLGALTATAADLVVAVGDWINFRHNETGSATSMFAENTNCYQVGIIPAD